MEEIVTSEREGFNLGEILIRVRAIDVRRIHFLLKRMEVVYLQLPTCV